MTEEEARAWVEERYGRAAAEKIATFLDKVAAENIVQNLVSPTTIASMWSRHVVDSAQLLALAPSGWTSWLDIGTGGGFPGMIVALLAPERHVIMVEPRARRAAFLQTCTDRAQLIKSKVVVSKVEALTSTSDVISARAVAPVEKLLRAAGHCAKVGTTWLLPRGRSALHRPANTNSIVFHVKHSVTDPQSIILVGTSTGR